VKSELRDLYQEVVIDHSKKPRNFRKPEGANRSAEGINPLCGDEITVYLKLSGDVIEDIGFQGAGCAISKASASLMTAALKNKTKAEAEALFQRVHSMVSEGPSGKVNAEELGKLAVLSGVWEFPARVKCATLAWHTLRSALDGSGAPVSTE
jgi:nitrogen fixation protein NifU and related proteins